MINFIVYKLNFKDSIFRTELFNNIGAASQNQRAVVSKVAEQEDWLTLQLPVLFMYFRAPLAGLRDPFKFCELLIAFILIFESNKLKHSPKRRNYDSRNYQIKLIKVAI